MIIAVLCSLQVKTQTWNTEEEIIVDGLAYLIGSNPNAAMVTYRSDGQLYSGNITIPEKISHNGKEYPVTVIGWGTFRNCPALISVVMPNSVTIIEDQAFECCNVLPTLQSVILSNSVIYIGSLAFLGNTELEAFSFPNTLTEIGEQAFRSCTKFISITLSSTIKKIGSAAFDSAGSIQVDAGNPNYSSLDGVLYDKSKTTIITYPGGKKDANFIIPNSVLTIETFAFGDKTYYLNNLTIPNSVTTIKEKAFNWVGNLREITVQWTTPLVIPADAFWDFNKRYCTLHVPAGTEAAYRASDSWKSFFEESEFDIVNGVLLNYYGPGGDVEIPTGVTSIGNHAFYNQRNLTSIILPNGITNIEYSAFNNCSTLKSINFPNSLTRIGMMAFLNCSSLTSISIAEDLSTIENEAFIGCSNLATITVDPKNNFFVSENGVLLNKSKTRIVLCPAKKTGDYTIPNTVNTIEGGAFADCNLSSISIPQSVNAINYVFLTGTGIFPNCSNLTSINVAEGNTTYSSIDGVLFDASKTNLLCYPGGKTGNYAIPNGTTTIGDAAFKNCTGLTEVVIPNSVIHIGFGAFEGCNGLISVAIPNSVIDISSAIFYRCSKLTSIILSNSLTAITGSIFEDCSSLNSISIPNGVLSIGSNAFFNSGLTSVCIPSSVVAIGYNAFGNCSRLNSVVVQWETPLKIGNEGAPFGYNSAINCTLYVPKGTKALYQAAPIWKNFKTIEESDFTGISPVNTFFPSVHVSNNMLHVNSAVSETISVYSLLGSRLLSVEKPVGESNFPIEKIQDKVLIVKGSSGWVRKLIK